MGKVVRKPTGNQLYFRCMQCGAEHLWPQERIRSYCDKGCRNAAYYARRAKKVTAKAVS